MKQLLCCIIFLASFSTATYSQHYNCFDSDETMIYHGEFHVLTVELQGNLVIKKKNDSYRMSFFNDLGMSFFDAEISAVGTVSFKSIISTMDISILKNRMRQLFVTLFLPNARKIKEETEAYVLLQNKRFVVEKKPLYYEQRTKNKKCIVQIEKNSLDYPIYFTAVFGDNFIQMQFSKTTEYKE